MGLEGYKHIVLLSIRGYNLCAMPTDWLRPLSERLPSALPAEPTEWREICRESMPVLTALLIEQAARPTLIVVPSLERVDAWAAILMRLGLPEKRIARLPSALTPLIEPTEIELETRHERIRALRRLLKEEPVCVLATLGATLQRGMPPDEFKESSLILSLKQTIEPESVTRRITQLGYEFQEPVRLPGQFARRGGILDIFPLGAGLPVRIEFFGDEIDSIRRFEASTQRSIRNAEQVFIPPARETPLGNQEGAKRVEAVWKQHLELLPHSLNAATAELMESDLNALRTGEPFDRLELFLPWLVEERACALDYLPKDAAMILEEPMLLDSAHERLMEELTAAFRSRAERGNIPALTTDDYLEPMRRLYDRARRLDLCMMDAPEGAAHTQVFAVKTRTLNTYRGRLPALWENVRQWRESQYQIVIATDQPSRVAQALKTSEIPYREQSEEQNELPADGAVILFRGNLGGGFVWDDAKFALLTDAELFERNQLRMPARTFNEGVPITSILDLKPGDYVVHIHYGIGVFRGLTTLTREGETKEYLLIEYANPDKVYVPADQLDRVQKYLAPDDRPPEIRKLSSLAWAKAVASARKQAQEVAAELIKLYAAREKATRPPCGPDTPWQSEMESLFPYRETPTQLQAIVESKRDLESAHPMDRLVCGDVGFGKTEVAIRAAFKVLQEGRQVAVLCPTTVLAYQHWQTFMERFGAYPIEIALLSRLYSSKDQKPIVQAVKSGATDLIIGTHRLLSKDVQFHKLGLVIIDEEQRFGVMQKEKLKQLRATVDVLTLSATPIPRTLYMALTDIRDMSLITDPPPGRLPIRTYVQPATDYLLREAILRELQRDGQIFYVSHRIQGMEHKAQKLQELVPHARIAIAHGQMNPGEMEAIVMGFYNREYDILLSTTIIENGLDMPNVNTLIVDQADHFGLSQLYQLRGRVGRSDRQAYAYFLYRKGQKLTETAAERLRALQEFSHLGSGFALAMRDLEIRGAGNLLGTEQHGAMRSVGFELYQLMLREAVQRLRKGEPLSEADSFTPSELPPIKMPIPALLPETFVPEDSQRLWYYKRLAGARESKELDDLRKELRDRYGPLPAPAKNALKIMRLRLQADTLGVAAIAGDARQLELTMKPDRKIKARMQIYLQKAWKGLKAQPDKITLQPRESLLKTIEWLLNALTETEEPAP